MSEFQITKNESIYDITIQNQLKLNKSIYY